MRLGGREIIERVGEGGKENPADARNNGGASPNLKSTEGLGWKVKVRTQPGFEIRGARNNIQALPFARPICVAPYSSMWLYKACLSHLFSGFDNNHGVAV